MPKINEWPRQWKIASVIVGVLIVAGVGVAVQRVASSGGGENIADIFGIKNIPSLTKPVKYTANLVPEAKKTLEGLIAELRTQLKEQSASYDAWLSLAIRYKQAGDFNKAREVWEYLASIHPDDAVSRHNLGDLYHHFLTDYPKAENYYQQALELRPTNSLEYLALHELYRYSYKQNTTAAADILERGIERVTESQPIDLYIALANYYVDKKDATKAIANFTKARDLAKKIGNTSLVAQLNAEIAGLR